VFSSDRLILLLSMSTVPTLPRGFRWSAVKAGIKASGKPDVALAVCDAGATAAAMFTSNQVVAAPVIVGRRHMKATGGRVSAVLVNAGNANCVTGEPGIDACRQSCIAVTTDTKLKVAYETIVLDGKQVNLFGCAKGAGMIGPQLVPHATMLVYLFTDLAACSEHLQAMLNTAAESSFNSISIDGDMSTNDTVLLLASGASEVTAQGPHVPLFEAALQRVCDKLAHAIVDDGEGVTHVVTLEITGTHTDADAKAIARTIANSPLCKTAWSSADPNWGRLLAAAGRAGVAFDPVTVTISIGGLSVFAHGVRSADFDKAATHAASSAREYTIAIDFGQGDGRSRFITCDLTHEYVSINADYST